MGYIELEGMEFYAYHGHFGEEQIVGNHFTVDVIIETDTNSAAISDNLTDALDYQTVYRIIDNEMKVKSFLLENLTERIKSSLIKQFCQIKYLSIKVSKINPPLGGKVAKVSVRLNYTRE